jgi:hypothetical protein
VAHGSRGVDLGCRLFHRLVSHIAATGAALAEVATGLARAVRRRRLSFELRPAPRRRPLAVGIVIDPAVISVSFNLRKEMFEPIVQLFSPVTQPMYERPPAAQPVEPKITFDDAASAARLEAQRRGWNSHVERIYYSPDQGFFGIRVGEPHAAGFGNPWLYFDGSNGRFVGADVPGSGTAGDVFVHIQYPLHSGQIAGISGRIAICLTGIVVAMLSVTGVVIWLRKRRPMKRGSSQPAYCS